METGRAITIELKLTREKALFILFFLFLVWRPVSLGSETLTLTTYYPAPYGGYVALLTTGGTAGTPVNTLLARNAGMVGIGTRTVPPRRLLDVRGEIVAVNRLTMAQDDGVTTPTWFLNNSSGRFEIFNQPNINTTGTMRLTILGSGAVGIGATPLATDQAGDLRVAGTIRNLCRYVAFFQPSITFCGGSAAASAGYTVLGVTDTAGRAYYERAGFKGITGWEPTSGLILCCRIN